MALSKYDLSNEIKTSTEMGVLTPIHWQDVVPGDKIRCQSKSIIRLQPLLSPVYNSISYNVRYYYIPYRLLIKDFGRFLVQAENSSLSLPMLYDHVKAEDIYSSFNYLRLFGINWSGDLTDDILSNISALPFRALHLVYNYYFKNELLDDSYIDMMLPEQFAYPQFKGFQFIAPLFATYYSDYFTDAYPTPQVGSPVNVDLDSNNQILVPEIDFATRLQRFKERLLLVGKSYRKFLQRFHGVTVNSDLLDVPRLIGSASQILNISDVDQVAPSEDEPVGSTYGKSVTVASNFGYTQDFNEHGIVLGLSYVLPSTSYVQGIPREFQKKSRFDFFTPDFASVGMQELRGNELSAERTDTFGYTPRYGELRQSKNVIAGDFTDSLSYWHFGRSLRLEKLSKDFVKYKMDNRPFAVRSFDFSVVPPVYLYILYFDNLKKYRLCLSNKVFQLHETVDYNGKDVVVKYVEDLNGRFLCFKLDGGSYRAVLVPYDDITSFQMLHTISHYILDGAHAPIVMGSMPYKEQYFKSVYDGTYADMFSVSSIFRNVVPGNDVAEHAHLHFCSYHDVTDNFPVFLASSFSFIESTGLSSFVLDDENEYFDYIKNPDFTYTFPSSEKSVIFNHVLIANYNSVDALRPIPKLEF